MNDIYRKLQERLDTYSNGYPATDSGIELKILEKLFSVDDAEMFLKMSPFLETPKKVAERIDDNEEKIAEKLEDMAKRGLLFRKRKSESVKYGAIPYVVGIFEFQLGRVDENLATMMDEYYDLAFGETVEKTYTNLLRTIPINTDVSPKLPVAPYDDAAAILEDHDKIAIADCVCRTTAAKAGKGCDHPIETCFLFGSHAEYYIENGMGREITVEEGKEILKNNEKAGLVMQPFNAVNTGGMCSCCGCSCGVMKSIKMQPVPSESVRTNYFAEVDEDLCTGCSICVKRCHMDAISIVDKKAIVDLKRCIGCGLCVTTCKPQAITLIKKSDENIYLPPKSGGETYFRIAKERGIIK